MQKNSDNLNKKIKNLVMESANMTNNVDIVMPMNTDPDGIKGKLMNRQTK